MRTWKYQWVRQCSSILHVSFLVIRQRHCKWKTTGMTVNHHRVRELLWCCVRCKATRIAIMRRLAISFECLECRARQCESAGSPRAIFENCIRQPNFLNAYFLRLPPSTRSLLRLVQQIKWISRPVTKAAPLKRFLHSPNQKNPVLAKRSKVLFPVIHFGRKFLACLRLGMQTPSF